MLINYTKTNMWKFTHWGRSCQPADRSIYLNEMWLSSISLNIYFHFYTINSDNFTVSLYLSWVRWRVKKLTLSEDIRFFAIMCICFWLYIEVATKKAKSNWPKKMKESERKKNVAFDAHTPYVLYLSWSSDHCMKQSHFM